MKIEIVFEDTYCLVVNKPNNMLVHHAHHSRNVANELSLLQVLFNNRKQKFYPIHRLDRKTSGIILLAKETRYVAKFQALFTANAIEKNYLGVVRGYAPAEKKINSPVKGRDAKVHKEAITELNLLATIELPIAVIPYKTSRYSLVNLQPKTGRLHQLRIHSNKISHPLIGDSKYGDNNHNTMFAQQFGWKNLFLHAHTLTFIHPFSLEKLFLKATLPANWVELLKQFNWKLPID